MKTRDSGMPEQDWWKSFFDPDAILDLVRELNRYQKVRINTVFTGVGKGADFLRRLAAENDGVFVQK